jgi:hypothetical protein
MPLQSWIECHGGLAALAQRQLFFVGGAPRSGTTWLQHLLDAHPDVSCRGEGHFQKHLAEPMAALLARRREALAAKNTALFRHTEGYPLPDTSDADVLVATGILLALHRQCAGTPCRAVGEKTPENVFFFPSLKRWFPAAKFIGIARDPRDLLTSAWHMFHQPRPGEDIDAAKTAFIRSALPSVANGVWTMLELRRRYPDDAMIVTYEALQTAPTPTAAALFRWLGVTDAADIVAGCVAETSFAAMTGGRPPGVEQAGAFFRKGVSGDWASTLTPAMNDLVLRELGWMFPQFGWRP